MNTLTGVITNPLKRGGKGFQIKPDNDDNDYNCDYHGDSDDSDDNGGDQYDDDDEDNDSI